MFTPAWTAPRALNLVMACASISMLPLAAYAETLASATPEASIPLALAAQPVTLPRVKVAAEPLAEAEDAKTRTPGGVTVLDADQFTTRAVTNLSQSLRDVPGVWATSGSGGDNGFISVRGSNLDATDYDNNGILLLQDGLPVSAADGSNHNRFIDPLTARSMTVARGANALAWGASNLGGAIDFVANTARNSHPDVLMLQAGNHDQQNLRIRTGGFNERLDGLVEVEARHLDGDREHSRQRRQSLYANAGWQPHPGFVLRTYLTHIDNRQQLPGALTRAEWDQDPYAASTSAVAGNHQLNVKTDRLALKASWDIAEGQWLEAGLSSERQDLFHPIVDVFVDVDGPGPMEPINVFNLLIDTTQRNQGGLLRYHLERDEHRILAGLNLGWTSTRGGNYGNQAGLRGPLQDVVDQRARSSTLFVLDHWQWTPGWTLVYGVQHGLHLRDDQTIDEVGSGQDTPRNQHDRYARFNPRLGVLHDIDDAGQIYASLSRVHEAPGDMDLNNARNERGPEASLAAMRGTAAEIGWRGERSGRSVRWQWDVSWWTTWLRGQMVSMDDPLHPGITLTANADRTRLSGVDAWLAAWIPLGTSAWQMAPRASISHNAYTFRNDPVYGNNRLPSAPRQLVRAEWLLQHADGFYIGPTLDVVGPRFADYANTYRVAGYGLVGLRVGLHRQGWDLFVEASNLGNKAHVGSLTVLEQAAPDARVLNAGSPRSLYAGLRLDY